MSEPGDRAVGLCAHCAHAARVPSPRTVFWLCRLAASDARFERYPRLPRLECSGHAPGEPGSMAQPLGDAPPG